MCYSLQNFVSFTLVTNSCVTLPTGVTTSVTHVGVVHLTPSLILNNVLYVPSFQFNLLSVSTLTKSLNCTVNFLHDSCFIQDLSQGTMSGTSSKYGNLYYLSLTSSSNCITPCNKPVAAIPTNNDVTSLSDHELWHYRLGHPFFIKLNVLHDILDISHLFNTNLHCNICPLAK